MSSSTRRVDLSFGSLEYATRGRSGPRMLLLHGFPASWHEWAPVLPGFARSHRVYAPNLPGIGRSARSQRGYAKTSLARDLEEFVRAVGDERWVVVGHDIGGMVAHAFARLFPERVSHLVIVDVPLPGFEPWLRIKHDLRTWHFQFHAEPELPELLVTGRVRPYVKRFYRRLVANVDALDERVIDTAARHYRSPSQLRSGFDFYRGFAQDEIDAVELAQRPLPMPVLYVGGEVGAGPFVGEVGAGPFVGAMGAGLVKTGATDVRTLSVPGAGHWVAQEQPAAFVDAVRRFLDGAPVGVPVTGSTATAA